MQKKGLTFFWHVVLELFQRGEGGGGPEPSRNLADQFTRFEPEWADFAPDTSSPTWFQKAIYTLGFDELKNLPNQIEIG